LHVSLLPVKMPRMRDNENKRGGMKDLKQIAFNLKKQAQSFVPKNWKILCPQYAFKHQFTHEEIIKEIKEEIRMGRGHPNTLYVAFFLIDDPNDDPLGPSHDHSAMCFYRENISFIEIRIWVEGLKAFPEVAYLDALVHELAHVAVIRWYVWRLGKKQGKVTLVSKPSQGDAHHPIFRRAYDRMITRAKNIFERNKLKHIIEDLEIYRRKRSEEADTLLTVREASEILSLSPRTVKKRLYPQDLEHGAVIEPVDWFRLPGGQIRIRERAILKIMGEI